MSGFCDHAWLNTTRLRTAIHDLPFNRELAAGTLSRKRFQWYVTQDALYLDVYARVLAIAGARGPDGGTLHLFASAAIEGIAVEQALHESYFKQFGVDPSLAEPAPDCLNYTSFLLATAYYDSYEVLLAALLPCFWIYYDVGQSIARQTAPGNPYQAWVDTYSDEGFGNAVKAVIAATDHAAEAASGAVRAKMMKAFIRSTQYEYLFWDGAYEQRDWPKY